MPYAYARTVQEASYIYEINALYTAKAGQILGWVWLAGKEGRQEGRGRLAGWAVASDVYPPAASLRAAAVEARASEPKKTCFCRNLLPVAPPFAWSLPQQGDRRALLCALDLCGLSGLACGATARAPRAPAGRHLK